MNAVTLETPRRRGFAWALFAVAIVSFAVLSFQSGVHNLPTNFEARHLQLLDEVEAKSNLGVPYAEVAQAAQEAYPWWNNIMARLTGTYFGFGSNGTTDPTRYYASMEPVEKSVLSLHMMLGATCLVLGLFQFWPRFRRDHRTAHRVLGGAYVLSAYTMVGASVYHLLHTGIENTYQGFAFHFQLWFLVISTTIAQTLAIHFIRKRDFALHMGCQTYTYAAFLSAPLQRYDWMVIGQVYPHLTQGEVNNLVNLMAFWQCLLVAYLLFAWNRASAPLRSRPVRAPVASPVASGVFRALAFAAVLTTFAFYVHSPGLGQWQVARDIVPASTLAADAALFADRTPQNLVFATATGVAILSGMWLLMRDGASRAMRRAFYASAFVSGTIQVAWGWQLGEPSMQVIAGGGFYYISGVSLAGFAAIALWFERRGREHLWRETMVFAVNFAFAPAILLWQHALWWALGIVPQAYLDVGHGYILAAGGAILTATLNGFIGAITSGETRSRAIG